MMNLKLFETAFVPKWPEQLAELQAMAQPEPWRFKKPAFARKNTDNHILEKYILSIYQNQVLDHANAKTTEEKDSFFCIRSGYACFHSGLLTQRYKSIYALLERNRYESTLEWYFKGFFDDSHHALRNVEKLPDKPLSYFRKEQWGFYPDWEIRVNVDHILDDPENLSRIPELLQSFPNLHLLLESGVELGRRIAEFIPSMIVPQLYRGKMQYLLPISLLNPNVPDLAMTITPMDGYYVGNTCLNLEMAYGNARLLARPTAPWLTALVE